MKKIVLIILTVIALLTFTSYNLNAEGTNEVFSSSYNNAQNKETIDGLERTIFVNCPIDAKIVEVTDSNFYNIPKQVQDAFNDAMACYNPNDNTIYLFEKNIPSYHSLVTTAVHEMVHAWQHKYAIAKKGTTYRTYTIEVRNAIKYNRRLTSEQEATIVEYVIWANAFKTFSYDNVKITSDLLASIFDYNDKFMHFDLNFTTD